jgi:hypothetical protein
LWGEKGKGSFSRDSDWIRNPDHPVELSINPLLRSMPSPISILHRRGVIPAIYHQLAVEIIERMYRARVDIVVMEMGVQTNLTHTMKECMYNKFNIRTKDIQS